MDNTENFQSIVRPSKPGTDSFALMLNLYGKHRAPTANQTLTQLENPMSIVTNGFDVAAVHYTFDITDDFDKVHAGFGGNSLVALDAVRETGGLVMRIFSPVEDRICAQAWVYPATIEGAQCFIILNAKGSVSRACFARILLRYLGVSFGLSHHKEVRVFETSTGHFFVDGNMGSLVGPRDVIKGISEYDLKLRPLTRRCDNCNEKLTPYCAYETFDSEILCGFCFDDIGGFDV